MFSKALFKQSCKANGMMWAIITFAVCFMLACVMLISGSGNIDEVKNSIQDTIITKEVDAQLQKRALSYYSNACDGLAEFDRLFAENAADTLSYLIWCGNMPKQSDFDDSAIYSAAVGAWQSAMPEMSTEVGKSFASAVQEWLEAMPQSSGYASAELYLAALAEWQANSPATQENAIAVAYADACERLQDSISAKAFEKGFEKDSDEELEMLGSVMYVLNPNHTFDDFYQEYGEEIPDDYDFMSLIAHISAGDIDNYLASDDRNDYIFDRAEHGAAVFIAGNMSKDENVDSLMDALSSYGVTKEKYDSFGYTYSSIKRMSETAIVTYRGRLEYELSEISESDYKTKADYLAAVADKKEALSSDIAVSFLSTLPTAVSDALEEIGKADLYTLIVGSIFYKLAGLLLPIIYMIMASNNLIAGQVDSGSMAYVLSTSTKRSTVVFTQAVYLIGSLLAMFGLTTATGCVCLSMVDEEIQLTYANLLLLNLGAFLVLFALSGLCFLTSCVFDRSKRSMAIGGGLSIFALVAAMLGLFGSPVIPSVVRLDALNNFNYATIISLFDVISIIDDTEAFVIKFCILAVLGVIGYIVGSIRFVKKDLPL